jgi:transaldolase/glucose-6-phosphate isomerase
VNPLQVLGTYDQSVWLDYIRRHLVTSGELQRLVDEDGVTGVTSNPAIFEKAIAGSSDYTESLARHAGAGACDPKALYETLAIEDIQLAADVLHPVYARTAGRDGYVSLEVSPDLAHDAAGTVEEARRLWRAVGRGNLMIKVPATPAGIPAVRRLISEGLNVNVTLLFSVEIYERVAEAYMAGLEALAAQGGDVGRVGSVASFFVSRIDSLIDPLLAARAAEAASDVERARLAALAGRAAIANARLAYLRSALLCRGARWDALAARGARPQRLLWASTGTKNPAYRDTRYVEDLIGPNTVNTIPPATLDAFRDHGRPRASLAEEPEAAAAVLAGIAAAGISMPEIADRLLADGVQQFVDAFRKLLAAVAERHGALAQRALGDVGRSRNDHR